MKESRNKNRTKNVNWVVEIDILEQNEDSQKITSDRNNFLFHSNK